MKSSNQNDNDEDHHLKGMTKEQLIVPDASATKAKLEEWWKDNFFMNEKQLKDYFTDKQRYIQTAKVTLSCLVAYILSVYSFPRAIPPSVRYLIGVVASSVSLSIPSIFCVIGLLSIVVPFIVILGLGGSTLVLCGALGSKGWMCVLFVIVSFWFSGLRFEGGMMGLANVGAPVLILFANMISLSFYSFIEQADQAGQGLAAISALWTSSGLTNQMAVLQNIIIVICWGIICLLIIPLCPPYKNARSLLSQMLAPKALKGLAQFLKGIGQMLSAMAAMDKSNMSAANTTATTNEEPATTEENKEKQQEQQKKQEAMYNAGVKGLVHVAAMIDDGSNAELAAFEPRFWRPFEISWMKLKDILKNIYLLITVILAFGNTVKSKLGKKVLEQQQQQGGEGEEIDPEKGSRFTNEQKYRLNTMALTLVQDCSTALEQCANKLASSKLEDSIAFASLNERTTNSKNIIEHLSNDVIPEEKNKVIETDEKNDDTMILMEQVLMELEPLLLLVEGLVSKVNNYNELMYGPYECPSSNEVFNNMWSFIQSWFGVPYIVLKRLFYTEIKDALMWLTRQYTQEKNVSNFRNPPGVTIAWYLKYTVGVAILYILQVYYPNTHSFAIPVISTDTHTVSFVGWIIIGYLNATTPTVQGTLKKGLARFGGTVIGAFSAWAATNACGRYPNTNHIGIIVWLTVVTFVVSFWCIQPGFASILGQRRDIGTLGMYLLMTQALITLEAIDGVHDINDLTLNRMVSQLVGILMAMIISLIPPTVNGGHPGFAKNMIMAERDALKYIIQSVLIDESSVDDSEADPTSSSSSSLTKSKDDPKTLKECHEQYYTCMECVTYWKSLASMLYSDATKLFPGIHALYADPKVTQTLESSVVLYGGLQALFLHTEWLRSKGELGCISSSSNNDDAIGTSTTTTKTTKQMFQPVEEQLRSIIKRQEHRLGETVTTTPNPLTSSNGKEQSDDNTNLNESPATLSSSFDMVDDIDDRVKAFLFYSLALDESLTRREEELSEVSYTYVGTKAVVKK